MLRHSKRSLSTFVAALAATFSLTSGVPLAIQRPAEVPSASDRRSPPAPDAFTPPTLPAAVHTLVPMTLAMTTTSTRAGGEPRVTRQTVLRTIDRVLVATDETQSEWLFERNPVDQRRVSGYLIDHKTKRILIHQESDLRNGQQIRGWLDVLTLRFDPDTLRTLRRTGESRAISGITFERFVALEPPGNNSSEVWWNDALMLPGRVAIHQDTVLTTTTVDRVDDAVDASRLASPSQRFPSYRILEVTDAREP